MKKIIIAAFAGSIMLLNPIQGQTAKKWKIDKSHASVGFTINHFFSEVPGKFKQFDGDIFFDPANLSGSKASFEIMVNSVSTEDADRDDDLKSTSFFDEANYPKITFESSKFVKKSDEMYEVHGKLTMRGTTKSVVLPMKITGLMDNPWREGYVIMGVKIQTTLNRTEYGIGTGNWAATAVVGDEVDVRISMELDGPK